MKIGIFGNTVTFHYSLCKQLRKLHPQTELILDSLEQYPTHLPIWNDLDFEMPLEIARNHQKSKLFLNDLKEKSSWKTPAWVKEVPEKLDLQYLLSSLKLSAVRKLISYSLNHPSRARFLVSKEALKNIPRLYGYDALMVTALGPFYAYLLKIPFISWPNGGDVNNLPFQTNDPNPIYRERSFMINLGLKNAKKILSQMPTTYRSLKKLNLENKYYFWSPFFGDPEIFKPMSASFEKITENEEIIKKTKNKKIFFMPTRIDFDEQMGKGNGKAIRAFARLCKNYSDIILIVQDWYMGSSKITSLIKELNIQNNVIFNPNLLSKHRLAKFYNASDVVLNNFSNNTYGSTDVEVMACGKPLITNIEMNFFKEHLGEEPPILHAFTEDQIYEKMVLVIQDKLSNDICTKSTNWVKKHHGFAQVKELFDHLKTLE